MSNLVSKFKDWAVIIALFMSGITGKITYDYHGLSIEVEKKEKLLEEAKSKSGHAIVCE
jgi:hypothetical protein